MASTSGAVLLPHDAIKTMCDQLLPLTDLLTPNIPEAQLILKEAGRGEMEIHSLDDMKRLAKAVQQLGPKNVLLKGGHSPLDKGYQVPKDDADRLLIVDVLCCGDSISTMESRYQKSRNTHGTGCSLACMCLIYELYA